MKKEFSPVKAFISYSHRDERFRASLEAHLAVLKRSRILTVWHDRKIGPGKHLDNEIDAHLEDSALILLLVSPDFIASDYCFAHELRRAMEKHANGQARVVPVILRPVDWRDTPFAKLKALPRDGKPITSWRNRDQAYLDVTQGLREAVEELRVQEGRKHSASVARITLDAYQGSVVQVGGVGSRLVTKTAWLVTEHGYLDANEYITHFFNGAGDVLWVHCPAEFRVVGASSPTGNDVFPMSENDLDTPYGLLVKDQLQNTIVVTCHRKRDESERPRATGTICPKCGAPMGAFQRYCHACGFAWPKSE